MSALLAKILLAPLFVVAASLAGRRFGARTGGLIAGLPVVSAPILLVFALVHGRAFTATAAGATLLGLASLASFVVVYGLLSRRASWLAALLAGWLAFAAMTAALSEIHISDAPAMALACAALGLALRALPRAPAVARDASAPPGWDLPLRAVSALALVLALTAIAGQLGAHLSGLLTPFPVIASVLAVFTHGQRGHGDLLALLRGLLTGLFAYALFCLALALALPAMAIAPAFLLAGAAALLMQTLVLWRDGAVRSRPQAAVESATGGVS